jgi:hypothetical protein
VLLHGFPTSSFMFREPTRHRRRSSTTPSTR